MPEFTYRTFALAAGTSGKAGTLPASSQRAVWLISSSAAAFSPSPYVQNGSVAYSPLPRNRRKFEGPVYNADRVCIIVPAYNEEASVGQVITAIRALNQPYDIVVVNDGSTDQTAAAARAAGAPVLDMPFNVGIGSAVQTGLKYAWRAGYGIAMQVDGDGQHDPACIPQLVAVLKRGDADMVIGSRFLQQVGYRASFMRLFGIRLFAYLIGLVTNRRIFDATSGYRAYNHEALAFAARYYPSDFPEPESIVTFLRNGFRIKEVAVTMQARSTGQSSIGKDIGFRAAYFLLSNSIAIIISGFKSRLRRV